MGWTAQIDGFDLVSWDDGTIEFAVADDGRAFAAWLTETGWQIERSPTSALIEPHLSVGWHAAEAVRAWADARLASTVEFSGDGWHAPPPSPLPDDAIA